MKEIVPFLDNDTTLKLTIPLESSLDELRQRYLLILTRRCARCGSSKSSKDTTSSDTIEESCLLGVDCKQKTTIGLVVPIYSDTTVRLNGVRGISVSTMDVTYNFRVLSVQQMWLSLQILQTLAKTAIDCNFYPEGPSHSWCGSFPITSSLLALSEWNAVAAIDKDSKLSIYLKPSDRQQTESIIRIKLKMIMQSVDLDQITTKQVRRLLRKLLWIDFVAYKQFVDEEMLVAYGQMQGASKIFDYLYLGSELNARNHDELTENGIQCILNVAHEVMNYFPGQFTYYNMRRYTEEDENLYKFWETSFNYIRKAQAEGSKLLVHCKMGINRSATIVIAYAIKAYNWDLEQALKYVKERRPCIEPSDRLLNALAAYQGMLRAAKYKNEFVWIPSIEDSPREMGMGGHVIQRSILPHDNEKEEFDCSEISLLADHDCSDLNELSEFFMSEEYVSMDADYDFGSSVESIAERTVFYDCLDVTMNTSLVTDVDCQHRSALGEISLTENSIACENVPKKEKCLLGSERRRKRRRDIENKEN